MAAESACAGNRRDAIHNKIIEIVKNMTSDWDTGFQDQLALDTRLIADLGFESIDVVHFVVAIERSFERDDLPFEELLMADGRYVDELTICNTVDFLDRHLQRPH